MTSIHSDLYRKMIELLVEARKDVGVTQVELGKRLGQRQTFISKVELGERRLDAAEFIMMCRAVPIDPYTVMQKAEESSE
ncbi:helix-turn-helix transcriptional regulator [Phyllobacterium sp. TAF24]|uniref:helix-turn-helix domain-containing protein n=1 Tax=Phyllobacterium sp. TAF24 TaxID=3233068 RepID=UPI003F966DBC